MIEDICVLQEIEDTVKAAHDETFLTSNISPQNMTLMLVFGIDLSKK